MKQKNINLDIQVKTWGLDFLRFELWKCGANEKCPNYFFGLKIIRIKLMFGWY